MFCVSYYYYCWREPTRSWAVFSFSILDKLLPGDEGALRLQLMYYCEACTAPKMPEFILYAFHSAYRKLPWGDLHPDQTLMEAFFKVSCPLSSAWRDLASGQQPMLPSLAVLGTVAVYGLCPHSVLPTWYLCKAASCGNHFMVLVGEWKTLTVVKTQRKTLSLIWRPFPRLE